MRHGKGRKVPQYPLVLDLKQRGYQCYEVADAVQIPRRTLSDYCHGRTAIPRHRLEALARFLECPIAALLGETEPHPEPERSKADFLPETAGSSERKEANSSLPVDTQGIIRQAAGDLEGENLDQLRRQILQQAAELAGLSFLSPALVEAHEKLSSPIAVEEFLLQCASSLKACWHLLHSKGLILASEVLATYLPTLMTLAFRPSRYQGTAASLATEAKILQAVFAMHQLDLTAREMHCLEAIRCGRLSNDGGLLAAALMYLGYTYTYCLPQPEKAVLCYQEALQALGSEISLLRSDIYIGLADAYAKMGEEQKALEAIALAQIHFPLHPECDPRVRYADCRWSELYQWEGKTYLDLAQHYPGRGYYKQAFEAFTRSAALQPVGDLSTSETMLNQAEAARGLDDLECYVTSLREGALKGLAAGSQKRYSEACTIFRYTPKKWLQEKPIRVLAAEMFHQEIEEG